MGGGYTLRMGSQGSGPHGDRGLMATGGRMSPPVAMFTRP